MKDFTELVNLTDERLGASVVYANDEFFASKDNLLKSSRPVFLEGEYTDRGKWMDGWETRRRRIEGHDHCIVRLGAPGVIRGVVIDTAFFKGNYPESASIEACYLPGNPDAEALQRESVEWIEILPKSKLAGDSINSFPINSEYRFTHLRFHIYPDGGVARLRVYGHVVPHARWITRLGAEAELDLASVENGASVIACNDMFFGSRHNLIWPGRSINMGDGWETKRSRRAGPDWVIVALAESGIIDRLEIDTNHFKGNFPESCMIESAHVDHAGSMPDGQTKWTPLLARTKLQAHTRHFYETELLHHEPSTHVRVNIFPDGGISRLRLAGTLSEGGRERVGLKRINTLTPREAEKQFLASCGSKRWAKTMAAGRPYRTLKDLLSASDRAFAELRETDIREAFDAHPRIGEQKAKAVVPTQTAAWSSQEQQSMTEAKNDIRDKLAKGNAAYEKQFGFIYIVCATGKTPEEMLALLEKRLQNSPPDELRIATEEQRKISEIRLRKWVKQ